MIAPIFLILLFVVFEVSYDEFMQEVLDSTVQSAARQVQIGKSQNASNSTFVTGYMCPYDTGLLNCNNLFVRIQQVTFNTAACSNKDFYDATPAGAPVSGGVLQLGGFFSGAGVAGNGATLTPSPCATTTSSSGYCNAGPQEFILMSAVYVAPSFLDGLVLNHITYGGQYVRALYSTAAFETEPYSNSSPTNAC